MSNGKNCIICGDRAKSAEHVFPAALGGRRTNRGIYCQTHNNGFGGLVSRLQEQLGMMNGALEVRPDRKDKAKPFLFTSGDTRYTMLGAKIEVDMPPPFDPSILDARGEFTLGVPNLEVAQRWIEENQSEERVFEIKKPTGSETHIQTWPNHIPLSFGGCDFLQSVGYLALTFFAHSFAHEARQDGLAVFKAMLQRDLGNSRDNWQEGQVWWDGRDTTSVVGNNPYDFGHVLAVGVSEATSHAYAYVSFFSCFSFGVDLGPVDHVSKFRSVCTFINPLAEQAVDSVTELKNETFNPRLGEEGLSLHDMVHSGSASRAVGQFQQKLEAYHADKVVAQIFAQLPPKPLSPRDGAGVFGDIVQSQSQIIFNLLKDVVRTLSPSFKGNEPIPAILKSFVQADQTQFNGLAPIASHVLQIAMQIYAIKLQEAHHLGLLDAKAIKDLFYGVAGIELITREVIQPVILQR